MHQAFPNKAQDSTAGRKARAEVIEAEVQVEELSLIIGLRKELSSCIISAMTTQKMLRKGCQGYLAYVVETGKEGTILNEIPFVREFPDVFPDDIAGLPSEREVDFTIDLIPRTEPMSIPPYRMAHAELRELKAQLEE